MRLAIVSPYTLPSNRGNSILAERLKKELVLKGYDVSLFNSSNDDFMEVVNFKPHIIHSLHALRPLTWLEQIFNYHNALWLITLTGTDYNSYQIHPEHLALLNKVFTKANAITLFHNDAKSAIVNLFPHIIDKLFIVPQGIATSSNTSETNLVRSFYGISDNDIIFLVVAGIRPVKNIGFAIEAFFEIEKHLSNIKFVLIGPILDKNEANRIFKLGRKLSCFLYLGEQPHEKVIEFMKTADVFINTSLHEGMPGAVLEAMAEEVPVIATNTHGNNSIIKHGYNGYLVSLHNMNELIDSVLILATESKIRKTLGTRGKLFVKNEYSIHNEICGYESIYNKIFFSNNSK